FKATVGVDDEVGTLGSVDFQVYADASKIYDSGVMTGASASNDVDVSIAGANQLRLVVTDGGDGVDYDHADWALARVECGGTANPTGLQLTVGSTSSATPFTRTVIVGSSNSLSAASPQTLNGTSYQFSSWSDGGAQTHNVTAPANPATYTATYSGGTDTTPPT